MRRRTTIALSLLLATALCSEAAAFVVLKNFSGATKRWPSTNVSWTMANQAPAGLSTAQFKDALAAALASWQAVDCAKIGFTFAGTTNSDPQSGIHVRVQTGFWDPSVGDALAYASTPTFSGGEIASAEVVFNGVDVTWTTSNNPSPGVQHVQGVAAHEFGHAIGLDHAREFDTTMFFSGGSAELASLGEDDARGACFLYPASQFTSGGVCDSCESNANCASGLCLTAQDGSTYCGKDCPGGVGCPDGYACFNLTSGGTPQCFSETQWCSQGGAALGLGEFCYGHDTCSSGLCLVLPDDAYCSQECVSACPNGFACVGGLCLLAGATPYGGACEESTDCSTGTCLSFLPQLKRCTQLCGSAASGKSCPGGDPCLQDAFCVPPGELGIGSSCISDAQCSSSLCGDDGICTQACGGGNPSCPAGTTCTAGFCTGEELGASCTSDDACPNNLVCQQQTESGGGKCVRDCNPLTGFGCLDGDVCQWLWQGWEEKIVGTCVPSNGGATEGQPCGQCEADLLCVDSGQGLHCHKDCKLEANNLGCTISEKCVTMNDDDDPLRGVCVSKVPVLPQPDPTPDSAPDAGPTPDATPDAGPTPDASADTTPEVGPTPDASPDAPGTPDVSVDTPPGPDGTAPPDVAGPDGSATADTTTPPKPTAITTDSGGCAGAGDPAGPLSLLLTLLLGLGLSRRRRRGLPPRAPQP